MITRYIIEIEHQRNPVDYSLVSAPRLMDAVMSIAKETEEDDVDVGITGVRVIKEEANDG